MKTARQRAEECLELICPGYSSADLTYLEKRFKWAMKEQNQITRTACANAIADADIECDGVPYYKTESILALAQKVCMDVKAV